MNRISNRHKNGVSWNYSECGTLILDEQNGLESVLSRSEIETKRWNEAGKA